MGFRSASWYLDTMVDKIVSKMNHSTTTKGEDKPHYLENSSHYRKPLNAVYKYAVAEKSLKLFKGHPGCNFELFTRKLWVDVSRICLKLLLDITCKLLI